LQKEKGKKEKKKCAHRGETRLASALQRAAQPTACSSHQFSSSEMDSTLHRSYDRAHRGEGRPGDGSMVTLEYRIARDGDGNCTANPWQTGTEIERSLAHRPLTFEVGSRMVLPLIDHAVRRLDVGEETGGTTH